VNSLWEYSGDYFQEFKEELPCLRKGDLAIAVVLGLNEGLNRLFDGLNRSAHNMSNPVRSCLISKNLFS